MKMRVLTTKLRVEIENEMRVFLESLNFEIEMRVSQKSAMKLPSAEIELGPIYDRLVHKFSFSGLKMRLAGL